MRTRIYTGHGVVEYPDFISFKHDDNYIKVISSNTNGSSGAKIVVTNPSGENRTLEYNSELNEVTFDIYDTILNLYDSSYNFWNVSVIPVFDGVAYNMFTFSMKVYDGKTFHFRTHGSAKTFYWSYQGDLLTFNIFSWGSGTMKFHGNTYGLATGYNTFNLSGYYNVIKDIEPIKIQTTNALYTSNEGGCIWGDSTISNNCDYTAYLIRQDACEENNTVHIVYRDCDGCYRTITGGLLKSNITIKADDYVRNWDIVKNAPHKFRTTNSNVITVVCTDVRRDANLEDIMYSDEVMIMKWDGTWAYAVLNTTKLDVQRDETQDYTLEFSLLN